MFSIKAASQSTGISPETLRAWERRYRAIEPVRDESGRRIFSPEDVVRLRLLRRAIDLGHSIGQLAALDNERLGRLIKASGSPTDDDALIDPAATLAERLLQAVQAYDAAAVDRTLRLAGALLSPEDLGQNVLGPVLREVGERWHRGEMSIAQERMLSAGAIRLLTVLTHALGERPGPTIVFATLSDERHELGVLICAFVAASRGARCHYLGGDLPADEIARIAHGCAADVVAISVVMPPRKETVKQLRALCDAMGPEADVWVGGAESRQAVEEVAAKNCHLVNSLPDFETFLQSRTPR